MIQRVFQFGFSGHSHKISKEKTFYSEYRNTGTWFQFSVPGMMVCSDSTRLFHIDTVSGLVFKIQSFCKTL